MFRLKGDEEQIGGFDCICRGNAVKTNLTASFASYLGSFNNRTQQLKKLAKCTAARLGQQYAQAHMHDGHQQQ